MHLLSGSMALWLGIRITASQSLPEGEVILEEAVTRLYWWMEQKGINASSEFIGSEYTVVTVANVLNHCSFFVHGSTGIWHNDNIAKPQEMRVSKWEVTEINEQNSVTLMTEWMGLVLTPSLKEVYAEKKTVVPPSGELQRGAIAPLVCKHTHMNIQQCTWTLKLKKKQNI